MKELKGSSGKEFVEFFGLIGLLEQEHVEGNMPFAVVNSISTMNTMNPINSLQGPRLPKGRQVLVFRLIGIY